MQKTIYGLLRIFMGFIFLWAFFDKTFGLGFATKFENAWIRGGSPTTGFLKFGVHGPMTNFFHSLAGLPAIDWLFMLGLLFVGLTLILNRFVKWGVLAGCIMLAFMYLALMFPENNPVIDDHIIYILVLILIGLNVDNQKQTSPRY
jgi:thiosulfate dehydrogenase [quinone] large subunit